MAEIIDQVAWNLSRAVISELQQLLIAANRAYTQNNCPKMFSYLKAAKMRIISSLNPDERVKFKKMEARIEGSIYCFGWLAEKSGWTTTKEEEAKRILMNKRAAQVSRAIEDYNEYLMDLLEKYGYLINKKEDGSRMKFK